MAKPKKLLLKATLAAAALAAGPVALAVPGEPPAPEKADISVKQKPTLTAQEMQQAAKDYVKGMNDIVKRIGLLQDQSKRQKDIIRLNCVTDKVVQVRVNISIAEQSMASLQEANIRNDEGERTHEFTRLTIVNQKVQVLGAEAENCIGEDLSFVGATRVEVEIDPNIPQYDPTQPPAPGIDIERPGEASRML